MVSKNFSCLDQYCSLQECEFLTSRKLFSKATRMLVSILVLFFRLRLIPSMPMPGEPRALGLDRAWSDVRFSAQTVQTQSKGREVKTRYCKRYTTHTALCPSQQINIDVRETKNTYTE